MKKTFYLLAAAFAAFCCASCTDDAEPVITVESVTIQTSQLTLMPGETAQLEATVTPSDAANSDVTWTTSNDAVATVSEDGLVTAVSPGDALITATADSKSATCEVTVSLPAPNIGDYYYSECEHATYHLVMPSVLGDYYYSDGSWSSEIDADKYVIGIVFWVGDPSVDDAALRNDHPKCVHGLAVGLDSGTELSWQPACESVSYTVSEWLSSNGSKYALPKSSEAEDAPLQKMIGYNNTKAIETFNAAAANSGCQVSPVKWVVSYRSEVPAPASSSDWYIPSPKELYLLRSGEPEGNVYVKTKVPMSNIAIINQKLSAIGKAEMNTKAFWSSTEFDGNQITNETAWNCYFEDVKTPVSYSFKSWGEGEEYTFVRGILAF